MKDGGPAFPLLPPVDETGRSAVGYPSPEDGMTLRDYFAAKAMPFVAGLSDLDNTGPVEWAGACYEMADAMLRAREVQS
jgi:hypothetical protein